MLVEVLEGWHFDRTYPRRMRRRMRARPLNPNDKYRENVLTHQTLWTAGAYGGKTHDKPQG